MRAWCGPGAGLARAHCGPIAGQLRANCGPSAGQVRAQCGPGAEDRILQLKFGNPCLTWNSIDRRNRSNWSNSTCQFLTPAMFPFRIGQTHGRKTRPCRVSVSNRSEARPRISDMLCLSETGSALALGPAASRHARFLLQDSFGGPGCLAVRFALFGESILAS